MALTRDAPERVRRAREDFASRLARAQQSTPTASPDSSGTDATAGSQPTGQGLARSSSSPTLNLSSLLDDEPLQSQSSTKGHHVET